MHLVIFEYRLRPDADTRAYSELSASMHRFIEADPSFGYLGGSVSTHEDGTVVAIECFTDREKMRAWRTFPAHREAQRRGREEFYSWYRTRSCEVERENSFELETAASQVASTA